MAAAAILLQLAADVAFPVYGRIMCSLQPDLSLFASTCSSSSVWMGIKNRWGQSPPLR